MRELLLFKNVRRETWQNDKVKLVLNVGSVPPWGDLAENTRSFARIIVLIIDWEQSSSPFDVLQIQNTMQIFINDVSNIYLLWILVFNYSNTQQDRLRTKLKQCQTI